MKEQQYDLNKLEGGQQNKVCSDCGHTISIQEVDGDGCHEICEAHDF